MVLLLIVVICVGFAAAAHLVPSVYLIPMTLGPRILRTETAGLAAISAFMSLYGEME